MSALLPRRRAARRALRTSALAPLLGIVVLAGCGGAAKPVVRNGCTVVTMPKLGPHNEAAPTKPLSAGTHYAVTLTTNCGSFTFAIDQAQSPHASASFVNLVQKGFFDHTIFHRIIPGFVIQGGDPTGTGTGGPGYTTVDTPPADAAYTRGVVAMAKTQSQAPGTAGSQFFVVTEANAGLAPDYAIIGKVTSGLAVVARIGRLGDPSGSGAPTMVVEIEKASVSTSA
jgi:cyclophilin family peptidyl-prolyl cis-trans isomerase